MNSEITQQETCLHEGLGLREAGKFYTKALESWGRDQAYDMGRASILSDKWQWGTRLCSSQPRYRFRGKGSCTGSEKSPGLQFSVGKVEALSPNTSWTLDFRFPSALTSGTHLMPLPAFCLSSHI